MDFRIVRMTLAIVVQALALSLFGAQPSAGAPRDGSPTDPASSGWLDGYADGDSVYVAGSTGAVEPPGVVHTASTTSFEYQRRRQVYCGTLDAEASVAPCVDGAPSGVVTRVCADGSDALDPLFRREVEPTTGLFLGPWEQVDGGGCPEDVPAAPVSLSLEEFRRLPLAASAPQHQPADGRGLVNMDLVVYTDPGQQTLTTTVLGTPVVVRATPVEYAWDFGDGSAPLITSDPGTPYPDHTIGHPYREPGTYAVQLVTTWSGEFQVDGAGPWTPIEGTATTASPPFTAEVVEARTQLIAGTVHHP